MINRFTSTECKTLKGERRMIFIFNIITAHYNQDRRNSWQEGRNSIVTTVSRKTAHRRISFLIVAVSAPERHWIGFQSHFARAAHATYSVGTVRSSGLTYNVDTYKRARGNTNFTT